MSQRHRDVRKPFKTIVELTRDMGAKSGQLISLRNAMDRSAFEKDLRQHAKKFDPTARAFYNGEIRRLLRTDYIESIRAAVLPGYKSKKY